MSHHNGITLIREVRPKNSFPLTEIEREAEKRLKCERMYIQYCKVI